MDSVNNYQQHNVLAGRSNTTSLSEEATKRPCRKKHQNVLAGRNNTISLPEEATQCRSQERQPTVFAGYSLCVSVFEAERPSAGSSRHHVATRFLTPTRCYWSDNSCQICCSANTICHSLRHHDWSLLHDSLSLRHNFVTAD